MLYTVDCGSAFRIPQINLKDIMMRVDLSVINFLSIALIHDDKTNARRRCDRPAIFVAKTTHTCAIWLLGNLECVMSSICRSTSTAQISYWLLLGVSLRWWSWIYHIAGHICSWIGLRVVVVLVSIDAIVCARYLILWVGMRVRLGISLRCPLMLWRILHLVYYTHRCCSVCDPCNCLARRVRQLTLV